MKKINLIGLSVASVAILAGCGGGGNPPSATNTGTGYYVDSAVEGVNYTCGSQTGVTDKDGKFTFEEGAGCKFSIAGITLREVSKDKLANGKKVLENDLEVAQFLQSIDSDGDASNGIQITPKVLHILNEALKGKKDVPKGDELVGVVSEVEQQDHSFKGKVKTKEEVIAHLEKSSTQITKELLAGKTFYAYIEESDHTELVKLVINKDATSFTGEVLAGDEKGEKFSEKIEIKGTHLIQYHDDGDIGTFIVTQKANYIELKKTEHNNIYKFFNTEAEAKAEYDKSIKNNPYSAENLKKYFAGKTFYFVRKNELRSVTVSKDGKVLNFSNGNTYHISYKDHMFVDEDGEFYVDEITDKYVKGHKDEEFTLYLNKADAEAELNAGGGNNNGDVEINDLVSGHVDFKDFDSVPSDAWIRIVPSVNQQHGNWEGPRCRIDSNGDFGIECYIDGNKEDIENKFNKAGETFQVVVYKNHIEPEGHDWNCGEDVYKYVGESVNFNGWKNITVTPEDYQDRSGETCNG